MRPERRGAFRGEGSGRVALALAAALAAVAAPACSPGGGAARAACEDLSEPECASDPACKAIGGVRFESGSVASFEELEGRERSFAACAPAGLAGADAPGCIYHPGDAAVCYYSSSQTVPEGWVDDFECQSCFGPE